MNRPTGFQTGHNGSAGYVYLVAPLSYSLCASVPFKVNITATVVGLFLDARPSAIVRLVASVVVDAVKRMVRSRSFADIGQKIEERRTPTITDPNTSTSVSSVVGGIRVLAPCDDVRPRNILSRPRQAVDGIALSTHFDSVASTRRCFPVSQIRGCGGRVTPTIASAAPSESMSGVRASGRCLDNQMAEAQSCNVDPSASHCKIIHYLADFRE